ncbi:MAG: excinuclease ABC subunit UvrC [Spirochaetes bacterium]|nr:excinuclease ABC subunit UvrC [Spirochaetota bacterium]
MNTKNKSSDLLTRVRSFPLSPGVYLMKDRAGNIIYVGKAKNLKNRVISYFRISNDLKTSLLSSHIHSIEFIVTENEMEALILESNLIKKHYPKYNISLKDDKRYPFIKITFEEDYPRLMIVRKRERDRSLYFGPYTSARSMRGTLGLINKIFPTRKCNKIIIADRTGSPFVSRPVGTYCLYYQMKQCGGPCQGGVDPVEYKRMVRQIALFLQGKNKDLVNELNMKMKEYTKGMEYEKAALMRDRLIAIESIMERQRIISSKFESKDVLAFTSRDNIFNITLLFIREGKMIGKNNFIIKRKFEEMDTEEILTSFIKQYYSNPSFLPAEVLVNEAITERELIQKWLFNLSHQKISIKKAQTDFEKRLIKMAFDNSTIELGNFLMDIEMKESQKRLLELKKALGLKRVPTNIEAFDISNIQGDMAVGSMVKFINARPSKNEYRKFRIKSVNGMDDFKSMEEVVYRRYKRLKEEKKVLPDLVLIDGGKGQLSSALSALYKNQIKNLLVIALAKKEEQIFLPGHHDPLTLPRTSQALKLLQNIRDEAHRFAIQYHKTLRKTRMVRSEIDGISGIGPKLKKRLFQAFGNKENMLSATEEDLVKVPGITRKLAEKIKKLGG